MRSHTITPALFAALLLVFAGSQSLADTHYVNVSNSVPVAPYTNWTDAATTIQDAVDAAIDGDIVLVTNGIYDTGGAVVEGSMTNRIAITNAVTVRGVNGPGETVIVGRGPLGDMAVRCAYVGHGARLEGFTLTNGYTRANGDDSTQQSGGGVWCESTAMVSNCIITRNVAAIFGGGAYDGMVQNCIVSENIAANSGGGASEGTLRNCIISGNFAALWAGGTLICTVQNCTIFGNAAAQGSDGAVACIVQNCIVYYNSGSNHDLCTVENSCTTPDPGGSGNVTNEPQFVNASASNFRLLETSPCIDAGVNYSWMSGATDLDGNPRVVGPTVDMGAYEFLREHGGVSPVHYVAPNGTEVWPYTNWVTAAQTIQAAVGAAGSDDTVLVTNGVYDTGGMVTPGYSLFNRVCIARPMTVRSVNGSDNTFIVGAGPDGPSAVRCAYVTDGVELIGFTLANGHTRVSGHDLRERSGGGVFCDLGGVVSNCTISGSTADNKGGGVFCNRGGSFSDCTLSSNSSDVSGGGVYCEYGGTLNRCILNLNTSAYGGGAHCWRGGAFTQCVFTENSAVYDGGGVSISDAGTFRNCLFENNVAGGDGGGVRFSYGGILDNCTLDGNEASGSGGGAYCRRGGTLNNCIAWDNPTGENWAEETLGDGTFAYCCTTPSVGVGCITNDPQFAAVGNYRLQPISPCIDGGTNLPWMAGSTDLDEHPRIMGPTVDIGAYESLAEHGGTSPVHYVAPNGTEVWPYTNWVTAAQTIQAAVGAAGSDDTVLVTNGVYATGGMVTPGYSLFNRVCITRPMTVRSVNGSDNTFIVGAGPCGPSAVRCAYVQDGVELIGFTLTNGHTRVSGDAIWDRSGGGLICDSGGTVSNCTISGNGADYNGGGAYGYYGGTLAGCSVRANLAVNKGGGVFCNRGGTLEDCILSANVVGYAGGGLFLDNSGTLNRCTVSENVSDYGGGVYFWRGGTLNSCVVSGNAATNAGGGVFFAGSSAGGTLNNCTLSDNAASQGGGVSCAQAATFNNCILWGNPTGGNWDATSATGTWVNCNTTPEVGINCLTNDPQFVAADNLRLQPISPCIDAGAGLPWMAGASDLDGYPRIMGPAVDMGAYESMSEDPGLSPIHYVSPSGTELWPYTNWVTAARTIQAAVGAAGSGDTVLVTNGVYDTGGIVVHGATVNRIAITKAVTVRSVSGPESTFIVGSGPFGATAVRCAYVGDDARLEGFTLTNGHTRVGGDYPMERSGGGAWCAPSAVVSNCAILANQAFWSGGGTYDGTLQDCTISRNEAGDAGGGTYDGTLQDCLITGNQAKYGGGTSDSMVQNCTLSGNTALEGGGAIFSTMRNCVITGNRATWCGGGAYLSTVQNCTITGNQASYAGGGTSCSTLQNCIVYYNTADVDSNNEFGIADYSCTTPDPGGSGNITNEPRFVDASVSNYHLWGTSPCIDAGTNLPWMAGATDLDGLPRIVDGLVDMGAYEHLVPAAAPVVVTLPGSGLLNDSATLNGTVDPNHVSSDAWFEWGPSFTYGRSTVPQDVGSGVNPVALNVALSNLTAGLTYHYRCVASNSQGVAYGEDEVCWIPALSLSGGDTVTHELHQPFVDPLGRVEASPLAVAAGWSHSLALKADGGVAAWGTNSYGGLDVPAGATGAVAVAAGAYHNLALKADGTVIGWGQDDYGQATIPAGAAGVVAIDGAERHSLALLDDGTIVAWGSSGSGRLNVPAQATNVVAISGGGAHSLALCEDGTVWAWGWNGYGQTTVPSNLLDVAGVSAGRYHSLALRGDGTVVGWGHDTSGQATPPAEVTNVVALAAGGYHGLGLRADGTVVGWGGDTFGQSTIPAEATNVVEIAAGVYHSLALRSDGEIIAWGRNDDAQGDVPPAVRSLDLSVTASGTVDVDTPGVYELTYCVTNLLGAVATATRTVHVVSTAVEPVILGEMQLGVSNGFFTFSVEGAEGQLVVIEVSTNLPHAGGWDPIQTHTLGSGPLLVTDPKSAGQQQKSYRVVSP